MSAPSYKHQQPRLTGGALGGGAGEEGMARHRRPSSRSAVLGGHLGAHGEGRPCPEATSQYHLRA
jgi:hypothetical protein